MKKTLFFLIYLLFQNIGHSQLTIDRIWALNGNKSITINAIVDTLEINETNTIEILSATAKNNDGQIIKSSEAYPDMYYHNFDRWIQIIFKSQPKPIYSLDSLKVKIKYFTPTEENKSLITINNPLEKFNLNLIENEYPKKKFIILDFYTLKNLKKKNKKEYKTLIEKIEERNKVAKDSIALFMNMAFQEYKKIPNSELKKKLLIYIEDEGRQIQKIATYDKNGMNMDFGGYYIWSKSYTSLLQIKSYNSIPENNWMIKLYIENEKSTKEIELKMENIVIPENKKITH
ncbi:hypothetical protein FLJC2902T_30760 [Flavobacterium limnosediminis JC2902]|uniref:Uncharacterized protein n=1 Tax=Flavobacterium limnosediminis JC2902 TaxID=1341181 RepID=V6SH82_9FLAO|nr:hypothetical protein [Flavobacterium limnosediminis]ESU25627.1 hypothetical protein FLJC2902T_30760 [Flavobacterium limnosediminis JC2902]